MAETCKWLRHAGNGSDPLAKDSTVINAGKPYARYDGLIPFSFLILIGFFATLYP
jgi:hypothetical protein